MRVGLFCSSLPEPSRKPGGVDVFVDMLGNALVHRGHEVTMFSFTPAPRDAAYASVQLEPASYAHRKIARMTLVPLVLNRVDTSPLDVLHLHGDDWFFAKRRLPTVRTFHGSALHEARTATGTKRRVSQYATYALEILASRLATTSYLGIPDHGAAYRPAGLLPYAVDVPEQVRPADTAAPIILFVGTWEGRKRGRILFEAFQRDVLPRIPSAELHMVSDVCPEAPGVVWWDRPSRQDLTTLYGRASVFCLPSRYEGFGLPYAEAMAAGTPVVSTDNPGARFVLDEGRAGMIVDEHELGARLIELLSNEPARVRLASVGRGRVQRFSWDAAVDAHEHAYREAITRWAARRARGRPGISKGWSPTSSGQR